MASRELVLSQPLCFICNRVGKIEAKTLKSSVIDFFSSEDIAAAKVKLMDDVGKLQLTDKLPHIAQREGDGRTAYEVDDILTLVNFLDQRKLLSDLPRYVTDNPDITLPMRLYEGDLGLVMKKLDIFENKLDVIATAVAAMMGEVHSSRTLSSPDWPPLRSTQPSTSVINKLVNQTTTVGTTAVTSQPYKTLQPTIGAGAQCDDQLIHSYGTAWAAVTSTPSAVHHSDRSHGVGRSTSVADSDHHLSDNDQSFTEVTARKRRRHETNRPAQPSHLVNNQQSNSQVRQQPVQPVDNQAARSQPQPQRGQLLVGNSTSYRARHVTAAASYSSYSRSFITERSVYCIDNVSQTTTINDICDLVSRMDVRVLSCFEVQPRRRRNEAVPTDRKAFRLCVHKDDRHLLLDPAKWPMHITVSKWFFKSAQSAAQAPGASGSVSENDEQRRESASSRQQQQQQQNVLADENSRAAASRSETVSTDAVNQCHLRGH